MKLTLPDLVDRAIDAVLAGESYDTLNRDLVNTAGSINDLPIPRNKIKKLYDELLEEYKTCVEAGPLHVSHFTWKQRQANLAERIIEACGQIVPRDPDHMFEVIDAIRDMSNSSLNSNYRMRRDRFEHLFAILDDHDAELSHGFRVAYEYLFPADKEDDE